MSDGTAGASRTSWSPPVALVVLGWAGAVVAALTCVWRVVLDPDAPAALFAAVTAGVLGLAALFGTRARPRLHVDASGITVRGLTGPRRHPWEHVRDVRVHAVRRLGREQPYVEIDVVGSGGDERLLMFGRLDLDDDPVDVAATVRAARPR